MSDDNKSQGVSIPDFVIQEAKEKYFEIEVKAAKEFEREKANIVEKEKQSIDDEYERKLRAQDMEYRIQKSACINKSRLEKMEARNRATMKVFSDVQYRLSKKIRQDQGFYKRLMEDLIIQGLIRIFEKKVKIRCLENDAVLVNSLIPQCREKFIQLVKKELEQDFELNLELDEDRFLEPRLLQDNGQKSVAQYENMNEVISKHEDDRKCFGGVQLTNDRGDIICKNTIDVRVDLVFQDSLPDIRQLMFPQALKK